MRTTLARLVAVGLLISACSVAEVADTTTTSQPATTTSSTSTTSTLAPTTTADSGETSLINGLPVDDPTLLDRRVLAVKIDNHPRANPQSGINHADMVMEVLVEGITRFISVWHESDVDYLGPMRSGRPTDAYLMPAFNNPTFAISGGQGWVQNLITGFGTSLIKELSEGTFRVSGRSAPHNLYVDTFELRATADSRDYPDDPPEGPLWEFGPLPAGAETASEVDLDFAGNAVNWTWDDAEGLWLRTAYGQESTYRDEDGTEGRIGVPVMVALYVEPYTARPGGGQSGAGLPSSRTTGSGPAFVFADGQVVEGTWERETETEWFTLTDANGETIPVPPGKIWVSLVPSTGGLTVTP
jgi:Protein of unknown function (DUF3048) N-terminal domain/Protein of unknown function (DUF3048) C-terminal domain